MKNSAKTQAPLPMLSGAICGAAALALLLMTPEMVLAQAGQTGGVIGKQGKSISSEEAAPAPRDSVPARKPSGGARREPPAQAPTSACSGIVGRWRWLLGTSVVFAANGSNQRSSGDSGSWSCAKGIVVATWKSGYVDTITISPDGQHLSITNSAGLHFSARR